MTPSILRLAAITALATVTMITAGCKTMLHPYGHDLYALEVYAPSGQRMARSSLTRADIGGSGDDGCGTARSPS